MKLVKVILVIVTALRHTEREMWQKSPICRRLDEPILYDILSRIQLNYGKAANISLASLPVPPFSWSSSVFQMEASNSQIRGVDTGYVNKIECICDNSAVVKCRLSGEFPILKVIGTYYLSRAKGTFELSFHKTSFRLGLSAEIQKKNNADVIVENVGDAILELDAMSSSLVMSGGMILRSLVNRYEETINAIARDEAAKYIIVPLIEALIKPAFKIANTDHFSPLSSNTRKDNF